MAECPKKTLMNEISQCEFILIDINLYLDTHPTDEKAIADYNDYAEQLKTLKKKYVKLYGPLSNFGSCENIDEGCFLWAQSKFPWNI